MDGEDLKAWREARDLTQLDAANLLGVNPKTIKRYESSENAIPPKALNLIAEMEKGSNLQEMSAESVIRAAEKKLTASKRQASSTELTDAQIMAMTKEERYELPPHVRRWRWRPGTFLPKGIYREHVIPPDVDANGAVTTQIQRSSNGVGLPSMILIGSTKNIVHAQPDVPGFYRMAPGAYRPAHNLTNDFKPNHPDGGKQAKRAA